MILDAQNLFSSAQALAGTGTVVSTNTIDLSQSRDVGAGEPLNIHIGVDVAGAGGTSVEVQIITSASANLASPTVIGTTGAIPLASLTLGATFTLPIPRVNAGIGQRYLGVQFVRVGTFTALSMTAAIVEDVMDRGDYYPVGFAVA